MRLALHIGASGLRGLQPFLARRRDTLAQAGVCYPKTFGSQDHAGLAKIAFALLTTPEGADARSPFVDAEQQTAFRTRLKADLVREVAASKEAGIQTWLMSDGELYAQIATFAMAERVRNLLARFFSEITVHIHLRPQVEILAEEAIRRAREGRLVTHAAFADPEFGPQVKHLDYNGLVLRWEKLFGAENVRVVSFRRQPSILDHLCGELGIDAALFRKDGPDERAPPGWRAIALANALNQAGPGGAPDIDSVAAPEPLSVSPAFAAEIQARFDRGNAKLAARRADVMVSDFKPEETVGSERPTMPLAEAPCLFVDQLSELLRRKDRELAMERYCRLLAEFRQAAAEKRSDAMAALQQEINRLAPALSAENPPPVPKIVGEDPTFAEVAGAAE